MITQKTDPLGCMDAMQKYAQIARLDSATHIELAAAYAKRGWWVFPTRPAGQTYTNDRTGEIKVSDGKLPATGPEGFRNATNDPDQVRRQFGKVQPYEGAHPGIGMWPGPAGLLVLDVDIKAGKHGDAQLQSLQDRMGQTLPPTLKQHTPSGGWHLFFRLPPGVKLGNRGPKDPSGKPLMPDVDIRSDGGYVCLEGTQTNTGGYSFEDWVPLGDDAPEIADAPQWLIELLIEANKPGATVAATPATQEAIYEAAQKLQGMPAGLRDLILQGVPEGRRSDEFYHAVAWCRDVGLTQADTTALLQAYPGGIAAKYAGRLPEQVATCWAKLQTPGDLVQSAEAVNVSRYRLLRSADIARLPPLRWLVRSVLPAEGLAAVYGPSGSGKSFLAMDLFAAVAEGRRWFEYRVEARPVVYLALEGEGGIRLRVQAWETKNGRPLPDSMAVVVQPFKLTCPADIADLVAAISAVGWVSGAVVVLDTLNRAAPTSDENASKDMGEILEGAKALQASLGGLVVVVHHTGKDATKGLRGHSSMFAALDACVEVTRDGERRAWSVAKSKDGQDGDRHSFTLDVVDLGLDDYGDEITSCVPVAVDTSTAERGTRLSNGAQAALDAFCAAAAKHGTCDDPSSAAAVVRLDLDDWRVAFYERSTADNADAKKQAFIRARRALVEAGKVTVSNFVYSMKVTEPGLVVARLVAAKEAEQGDSNGTTEEHCSDPLALEA